MTPHRAVIEVGPGSVRRLCCGSGGPARHSVAALECIDDPVALIDGQPVAVTELWASLLRSLACCPDRRSGWESVLIVHPSWWSTARVDLVAAAARPLSGHVVARPRSLLRTAGSADGRAGVVVEIAPRLVAITMAGTVAEPRSGPPGEVIEAVVRRVAAVTRGVTATVLIDGPGSVGGAAALAAMIADRLRTALADAIVTTVDDTSLVRAAAAEPTRAEPAHPEPATRRPPRHWALLAGGVALSAAVLGVGAWGRHAAPAAEPPATTFLVEGRVAVQVPAQWPVQRITTGPGSARVEVVSPSDPQAVLHVTQSAVPGGGTLAAAAESLKQAIAQANTAASGRVFVDFDPSAVIAGRPAATYRELRHDHHIAWTVLVDGVVRIAIGCQSTPGGAETVRAVCEQAVRSARVLR